MSIPNSNNGSSKKLPGIVIATNQKIIELEHLSHISQCIYGEGSPLSYFNEIIKHYKADLYVFMCPGDTMKEPVKLIDKVLNIYDKFQFINCIYTDIIYNNNTEQYFPSVPEKYIIETPLFIRHPIPYNTNVKRLYCYNMLLKLAKTSIVYHIPEICFNTTRTPIYPQFTLLPEVQEDLKLINE